MERRKEKKKEKGGGGGGGGGVGGRKQKGNEKSDTYNAMCISSNSFQWFIVRLLSFLVIILIL